MDYTKTSEDDNNDNPDSVDFSDLDLDDEGGELTGNDEDLWNMKKDKNQTKFSLQSRRAIEDHIEQRRLHKELDYLFDDDFIEGEEKK
jgi:hypothetical protein